MGVQQMRKLLIFSVRKCYKLVCNHPFLVGLFCFLILLYRSFPFVFSLMVSASPVIICTAVLLGTLLSFGQPNIPEIEREEKSVHDIVVPLKTQILVGDSVVVDRGIEEASYGEVYEVERGSGFGDFVPFAGNESREIELGERELYDDSGKKEESVERGNGFGDDVPLIGNLSREIELGKRELYDSVSEMKNEESVDDDGEVSERYEYSPIPNMDEENLEFDNEKSVDSFDSKMVNIGSPVLNVDDENLEFDNDKSVDSFDSKMVNVDSPPNSPPNSPLKREEEDEEYEEEEDNDESGSESDSDLGSDRAESSSPDASMADIIPMLDELHPLLDEETPQPNLCHDGSDAASEHSRSCESDQESDDETENQESEAKEMSKEKLEQIKSAISWTEEDQKNLMDLGSSELERNLRLESLIARRRARKEKNLIDLESIDLPFNVAPISTARKNPFDLPLDDYDLGLPPIPGSAPSVLHARRNPFDLPYDSGEEKPDLMEDSFQHEFKMSHAKESFFRRHESFNVRPSMFGPSKDEKRDSRLRPYFVPEETDSDGTSYSRFQRQSSELSDSKVSSIPETESTCSAVDLMEDNNLGDEETEDKNLRSEENHEEVGLSVITRALERQSSHLSSSSSSLSEEGEKIFAENETQWLSDLGETRGRSENAISIETLPSTDENQHSGAVYDLSPTPVKEISSSSTTSDARENVESVEGTEKSTLISEEMLASSPVEEHELLSEDDMDVRNSEVPNSESEKSDVFFTESDPLVTRGVVSQNSLDSKPSFDYSVDENILEQHPQDQTDDANILDHLESREFSSNAEQVSLVQPRTVVENLIDMDVADVHLEHNINTDIDNQPLGGAYEGAENSFPQFDELSMFSDHNDHRQMQESPLITMEDFIEIRDAESEAQEFTDTPLSPKFVSTLHNVGEASSNAGQSEVKENIFDEMQNVEHIDSSESNDFFAQAIELDGNSQCIEEIDEGILSELDAVGDFSVKESVSSLNEFESGFVSPKFLDEASVYAHENIFAAHSEDPNASMAEQVHEKEAKIGSGSESSEGVESMDRKSAEEGQSMQSSKTEDIINESPLVEASSVKDSEAIHEQDESNSVEPAVVIGESESNEDSKTEDIDSGMVFVEASSKEDLESIFEPAKLSSMETDSASEQLDNKENEQRAEKASGESESPENATVYEHSSLVENEGKFGNVSTNDAELDHMLHADTIESHSHESGVEKDSALKQELEDDAEKHTESGSRDEKAEATQDSEGGSSEGISSLKDHGVTEDSKDSTEKQHFEADKFEDSGLAKSDEKADREAPEGDGSSSVDSHKE